MTTDRDLLRSVVKPRYREATDAELSLFEATCERTGLDPLARQIYAQFRKDSRTGQEVMAIQATIDGFRVVAERSGDYLGGDAPQWCGSDGAWRDVWLDGADHPAAARVTVRKSVGGIPGETTVVAHWREYAPSGPAAQMWTKMPALMLAKVAEALALRRAFPMVLSGLYTADEMAQARAPEDASVGFTESPGGHSTAGVDDSPYVGDDDHAPEYIDRGGRDTRTPAEKEQAAAEVQRPELLEAAKGLALPAVRTCYEVAGLSPPERKRDAFRGLDDEQSAALEAALRNRRLADAFPGDIPYSADELAPVRRGPDGDDSDLPWSRSDAGVVDTAESVQADQELSPRSTPLPLGDSPIDDELDPKALAEARAILAENE